MVSLQGACKGILICLFVLIVITTFSVVILTFSTGMSSLAFGFGMALIGLCVAIIFIACFLHYYGYRTE